MSKTLIYQNTNHNKKETSTKSYWNVNEYSGTSNYIEPNFKSEVFEKYQDCNM